MGNHLNTACGAAGVHPSTVYRWLQRALRADLAAESGEVVTDEERVYCDFRDALALARARAEMRAVEVIHRAMVGGYVLREQPMTFGGKPVLDEMGTPLVSRTYAPPDGRLALAYLARSDPEHWGRSARSDPLTQREADAEVGVSIETIARLRERLRRAIEAAQAARNEARASAQRGGERSA